MNKTVNINLAGLFFHIDEDAYLKLQRYLEAIKRSFTDSQGRSEIIADIEARIAELFNDRVQNDRQVIRIKEVDEVITIMGQPEDYLVDDDIFEDDNYAHSGKSGATGHNLSKKLYRDADNSYIGGVASGLGHYLGIDAIWIRLLWVLLAFVSFGTFVFIYILFWILVPEAKTTAEKLMMTGEPVNISNIEKKIKDGFDNVSQNVSDAVKNIDLSQQSNRIRSGSKNFFDALGEIVLFCFKIFAKLIGILLIIIGASTIIGLIISSVSVGIADVIKIPGIDFMEIINVTNVPLWGMTLLLFFAIGIPFFFVFYLGLKILINNLKSIGNVAKFTLLGVWIMAIIGLIIMGTKQASEYASQGIYQETHDLPLSSKDTLYLNMRDDSFFKKQKYNTQRFQPVYDENDKKMLYLTDVEINIKTSSDTTAVMEINKNSHGNTYQNAKKRAEKINYNFQLNNNHLELDNFLTTSYDNKYRSQEIEINLYLPEGTIVFVPKNTYSYLNNLFGRHNYDTNLTGHFMQVNKNSISCLDCDNSDIDSEDNLPSHKTNVRLDSRGIQVKTKNNHVQLDSNGIKTETDRVKVKIGTDGINITTDN